MSRDLMRRLGDSTLVAVAVRGGDWPRRFMGAALIPDTWMGLVETRDGKRWHVPAGDEPRAGEGDSVTLVRNRPLTVPIDTREVPAACGNTVGGTADVLVRWHARDDELAALHRSLLSPGELTLQKLADAFADGGGRAALQKFIASRDAATVVSDDHRDALLTHLREQLKKLCFETGLSIEQVSTLKLGSSTLARRAALQQDAAHEVERIQSRELVEQAALAATQKRLGELGGVMEKLQAAAARGGGNMQWHELLPALTPGERGRLLESLWRITPDRHCTTAIVVVAGDECVWLDPQSPETILRRTKLPQEMGGVRSVSFDAAHRWLLVGAATGIWAIHAEDGNVVQRFAVPDVPPPRTGFNAAVIVGDRLYATHSQLGCWSWPLVSNGVARAISQCDQGSETTRADDPCHTDGIFPILVPHDGSPRTIRAVCGSADGRVLLAADDTVHAFNPATGVLEVIANADDTIHCLATLGHELFAGIADGKLLRLDLRQPEDWWVPYRTNIPIESVQARQWSDLVELIVPGGDQGVVSVYSEENVVTRLLETATPTRRAWTADDIVIALNDRRDRLTVMGANSPDRKGRDVVLARVLGGSIQDACLVTSTV
ncbi:MAG: hypothetical protein ACKVS9_03425 [Phycisphaerae bacterium]